MEEQRLDWIDMSKGIGIILVVLGHCFNKGNPIHNWIFSFHMPLFFILSGFCFHIEKYPEFNILLRKKISRLIVPFIKFWVLALFVSLLIPYMRKDITLSTVLTVLYTGWPGPIHMGSIWYLLSLFICMCAFWILTRIETELKLKKIVVVMIILSGLLGCIISKLKSQFYDTGRVAEEFHYFLPGNRLPLTIDATFTSIVFFYIGVLLQKKELLIFNLDNYLIKIGIGIVISIIVSLFLNSRVNLHGCTLGNCFYFYLAALAGSFVVMIFSRKICKKNFFNYIKSCFIFLGKNSLLMLGVQSLGINIYVSTINQILNKNYILFETVPVKHGVIMFFVVTLIFFPILYVLNKRLPESIKI
ncbi:MAG: acyltransferase family protein [Spirochaetia bacterium]|nr:acyltransferase family protein [Spirochaetia bacterium]